jgi:hypothetical protein
VYKVHPSLLSTWLCCRSCTAPEGLGACLLLRIVPVLPISGNQSLCDVDGTIHCFAGHVVQVSMDRCRALEAEVATYGALTRMPHPPAAPADASASTGDGPSTSSNTGHSSVAGPAATLTQQVISLQQQVAGLKREKESLLAQVQALEASLRGAQEQVKLSVGPVASQAGYLCHGCCQLSSARDMRVPQSHCWRYDQIYGESQCVVSCLFPCVACRFAWLPSLMGSCWMS